ncbi:MAG: helix-turn-helix transcriptional regulator, partial [Deltaproteobacteria bacterium]|nr:helix-turn-helix transcriptional regulator [Deltaproteobacteria bacterium]
PDFLFETVVLDLTEQICIAMREKGITRTKLAKMLGVSPAAVTKILNGSSNFTLKTMLTLASALDLELAISFQNENRHVKLDNVVPLFHKVAQGQSDWFQPSADDDLPTRERRYLPGAATIQPAEPVSAM